MRRFATQLTTHCSNDQQREGGETTTVSKMEKNKEEGRRERQPKGERRNIKGDVEFALV